MRPPRRLVHPRHDGEASWIEMFSAPLRRRSRWLANVGRGQVRQASTGCTSTTSLSRTLTPWSGVSMPTQPGSDSTREPHSLPLLVVTDTSPGSAGGLGHHDDVAANASVATATKVRATPVRSRVAPRRTCSASESASCPAGRNRETGQATDATRAVETQDSTRAAKTSRPARISSHRGAVLPVWLCSTPQRPMNPSTASCAPCQPRADVRSSLSWSPPGSATRQPPPSLSHRTLRSRYSSWTSRRGAHGTAFDAAGWSTCSRQEGTVRLVMAPSAQRVSRTAGCR